jgi:predicted nucleic acid-binding protein
VKYVTDASFIASLFLPNETQHILLDNLLKEIMRFGAAAPSLLQLELTNILLMAKKRKRITSAQFSQLKDAIELIPITLYPVLTDKQHANLINLAQEHDLTAYDAAYLELSLRLSLPLISLDKSLLNAAKKEGVKLPL